MDHFVKFDGVIELEITAATQYATAYKDGKPVATLQRRRAYERGPAWQAYANDGTLLFKTYMGGDAAYLARRVAMALQQRAARDVAPRGWAFAETSVEA